MSDEENFMFFILRHFEVFILNSGGLFIHEGSFMDSSSIFWQAMSMAGKSSQNL
jgi:hypothetical protein